MAQPWERRGPFLILPYCVYVLISRKDGKLYAGFSEDIEQRLADHHAGRVGCTAPRRPLELIHCEMYPRKTDALRREAYFKTTKGKRALKLMLQDTLEHSRSGLPNQAVP